MQLFSKLYIFSTSAILVFKFNADVFMLKQKLPFKGSVINYYKYGSGKEILFCLHGYGEDATSFSFLEAYIGNAYTLYSIDLPFHGETKWNENEPLSAENILLIFNEINLHKAEKFSILAYSFGGRIALYLLQKFPALFKRIVLIAPDGLHENFWYWLSTQTYIGDKVFKRTMQRPKYFFFFLNMAEKTHLLNKSIVKFVHHFLDDATERALLYKRWHATKKFKPDLSLIQKSSAIHSTVICFLFGNYDRIILSKRANIFKNTSNIHIVTIDAGHRLLNEIYASQIVSLLNNRF